MIDIGVKYPPSLSAFEVFVSLLSRPDPSISAFLPVSVSIKQPLSKKTFY